VRNAVSEPPGLLVGEAEVNSQQDSRVDDFLRGIRDPGVVTLLVRHEPMQYLTQWRLQLAANLLASTTAKVSAIGEQVGYESEAAFSRAFKRATGRSPAAYRRQSDRVFAPRA
jgi:AraC-like DNA-binding protein